jgi:MFS family permease
MANDWSPLLTIGILATAFAFVSGVVGIAFGRRPETTVVAALVSLASAPVSLAVFAYSWGPTEPDAAARGLAFVILVGFLVAAEAIVAATLVRRLARRSSREPTRRPTTS